MGPDLHTFDNTVLQFVADVACDVLLHIKYLFE